MKLKYSVVLAITITSHLLSAQNILIKQLPIIDQLPSNSVQRVFQDNEGYIWLGTREGLYRYDGYKIKSFRSDLNTPNLLTNNEIYCIVEDTKNNLLIGTQSGLNILDKKTYEVKPFPDATTIDKYIRNLLIDSDSSVWVAYNNGLNKYDKNFNLVKQYMTIESNSLLPRGGVNYIFEDVYNNIWVTIWHKGLYKLNKESDQFIKFPKIGELDNPFSIFQDNKNNYWIGTWGDGIYQFFPNSNSQNIYKKIPQWRSKKSDKSFYSITQDQSQQYIWAMSLTGLITFKYNTKGEIEQVDTKQLFANTNNIFSQIFKDNTGNLWIGAFSEGVFNMYFNQPHVRNFPYSKLGNNTNVAPSFVSICEDADSDVWIKQNRGTLYIYSPETKKIKSFAEYPELASFPELENTDHLFYISKLQEVWANNLSKPMLFRIKKIEGNIKVSKISLGKNSKSGERVHTIFEGNNGNIWIGTNYSLFVKTKESDHINLIKSNIGSSTAITIDINNTLWVSTSNNGIYKIKLPNSISESTINSLKIERIQNEQLSNNIQAVTADMSGNIWIGTKDGILTCYKPSAHSFEDFTSYCDLTGESILDLITDKFNHLWIVTPKTVIELNPTNKASFFYNTKSGLTINSHLKSSYYKTKDSEWIYFGGNRGYSCLKPSENLNHSGKTSNVKITDIKIQNISIFRPNTKNQFNKQKNTLTLNPWDKNIEIHFSTLNYDTPQWIRFAYKLDGINNEWVELKNGRQFAVYSQLKRGKYTFKVKATNTRNLWNEEITQMTIIKKPAYYETNLAFLLYFLLFIGSLTALIFFILSRIKLRNKLQMAHFEQSKNEELTQTKLKYFTNISHDLLTPLTIISCIVDDIETTYPKKTSQLSTIRSNVVRLKRLLQQILDFKRVEDGKMQLKITQSDIASFVKDICYNHFLPMFDKKQINFTFNASPSEINAYFDADKIDKVIFNLLSNAFKFTPENGSIKITLSLLKENQNTYLSIEICDTGIGIPKQDIKNIFTRFYTNKMLNASDTHGIGLSLCKDLIELHHGSISVKSIVHEGTTFTIKIPINKESYSLSEIADSSLIGISENASSINTDKKQGVSEKAKDIHILLVDDNLELLSIMQQFLAKTYQIYTAKNGLEAMGLVKSNDIDIMISDVMMPEMDGIELCKMIKSSLESSHISVILLTAKNSIQDRIECYNAGADAYISKPFEMKVLEARINNFINLKQSKQKEFKNNLEINISSLENHKMDEQFLNSAICIIEKNIAEPQFDINTFAEELNLSKSSLYRKIKSTTGLSPIEFIRNIKLKHASVLLKNNTASIADVAYAVGFSDPKYFSSCFKTEFNITPREFQKQNLEINIH